MSHIILIRKITCKSLFTVAACSLLLLTAAPADAGFQWVPAAEEEQKPAPVEAAPAAPVEKQWLEEDMKALTPPPEPRSNNSNAETPVMHHRAAPPQDLSKQALTEKEKPAVPAAAPVTKIKKMGNQPIAVKDVPPAPPVTPNNKPAAPGTAAPAVAESLSPAAAPVVGFGADMPLALALYQVVPSEYAFSFGDNVNPGYRVSWNGGDSWEKVVAEMIAPLNLVHVVHDNVVHIKAAGQEHSALEPAIGDEDLIKDMRMASPAPATPASATAAPAGNAPVARAEPVMLSRRNITDPGQVTREQLPETTEHIQRLAESGRADNGGDVEIIAAEKLEALLPAAAEKKSPEACVCP